MKKIITILVLVLITNLVYSQTPIYARAYAFSSGYRDESSLEIVWNGKPKDCDILIRFDEMDLIIYSKTVQKYHVIKKTDSNGKTSVFRSVDINGIVCNFYIGKLDDGVVFLSVEYSDYSWLYFIQME